MKHGWISIVLICALLPTIVRAQLPLVRIPPETETSSKGTPTPAQLERLARAKEIIASMDVLVKQNNPQEGISLGKELVTINRELFGEESIETAYAYNQLSYFFNVVQDYESVRKYNEKALAIRRKVVGNKHLQTALSLSNLCQVMRELGKYEEALAYNKEALQIYRESLGDKHQETSRAFCSMAVTLDLLNREAEAKPYFEKALAISTELMGEEDLETATIMNHLGNSLTKLKNYASARVYQEKTLRVMRTNLGEKHPWTIAALVGLARVMLDSGDNTAARTHYEKALANILEVNGKENLEVAHIRMGLGTALSNLGDYAAARDHYEQALAINREKRGEKHLETANVLLNLGNCLNSSGNYVVAFGHHKQALATFREKAGERDPRTVATLIGMGDSLAKLQHYPASRPYFERALAITIQVSGEKHPSTVNLHTCLGSILNSIGDQTAARSHFEKALAIQKESLGEKHFDTSLLLLELGNFESELGNYKLCRTYLERSLAIRQELLGNKNEKTVNVLHSLGALCVATGDYAGARKYLEQVVTIRKETLDKKHPALAIALNDLGVVFGNQGNYAQALTYLRQVLAIQKESGSENNFDSTTTFANLARYSAANNDWLAAARYQDQSRKLVRRHIGTALDTLSQREQLLFLAKNDLFPYYIGLSLALNRRSDPAITALSAGWVLNNKGLVQEVLADRAVRIHEGRDPKLNAITQKLAELRAKQAALTNSDVQPGTERTRIEQLTQLTHAEEDLSHQLAVAGSQSIQADHWVEIDEVRKTLKPGEVLIDIVHFAVLNFDLKNSRKFKPVQHYAAWIIPPAGKGNIKLVDLGDAERIDRAVVAMFTTIMPTITMDQSTGRIKSFGQESLLRYDKECTLLSRLILHPLLKEIDQANQLIISPDFALWSVPWAALFLPDDRFAIEQYQIRHVVSGRDLVAPASTYTTNRSLIVANPNFDLPLDEAQKIAQAVRNGTKLPTETRSTATRMKPPSPPRATPLPNFSEQAQLVAPKLTSYTGKQAAIWQGDKALESLVKAAQRPRVLLLATHGFYDPEPPMTPEEQIALSMSLGMSGSSQPIRARPPHNLLLHCGLTLAGCNWRNPSDDEDGLLTAAEIVGMDLRGTELVVLSACGTGMGEMRPGEGIAGVHQAFQLAGAQNVVGTLWPVLVLEATDQMVDLFTNLAAGQSKAAALRNAQLASIKRLRQKHKAAPPWVWAPFTITGKGR